MAKTINKIKRNELYHKSKKTKEASKRDKQFSRKREEDKNPILRAQRHARNIPATIDSKRKWDEADLEDGDGIALSVDVAGWKRQKAETSQTDNTEDGALTERNLKKVEAMTEEADESNDEIGENMDEAEENNDSDEESGPDDLASLMDDISADEEDSEADHQKKSSKSSMPPPPRPKQHLHTPSEQGSTTSTNLSHIPDALASKYPTLFHPPSTPKILITTEVGPNPLHKEAQLLADLFPNSTYVPRSGHRYRQHIFSLREIAKFAQRRGYTSILVLGEIDKQPKKLMVIHLPHDRSLNQDQTTPTGPEEDAEASAEQPSTDQSSADDSSVTKSQLPKPGPTFHFTINNFIPGARLPGHGRPTIHYPELILNGFRTPLGLLTASLFRTLFPPAPEVQGRQVVTLHNQRDYIFVRRHRYVFRERKGTERQVVNHNGEKMSGTEDIRTGLQELGPRFTLKLRRVEGGIHREKSLKSEWEWKAGMEKERTRFAL